VKKSSAKKKNTGGRPPQLKDGTLFNRRDSLIQTLSDAWGDIGWELMCVQVPDELIGALSGLEGISFENQQRPLKSLLQSTMIQASAAQIRITRKEIQKKVRRAYEIDGTVGFQVDSKPTLYSVTEQLSESEHAMARVSHENLGSMLDEHFSRLSAYRTLKHERDRVEEERKVLEVRQSHEEAFYVKEELFRFIRYGKYAHNPRNLANAMAGLPELGCWQSFQRCEKKQSDLWPTRPEEIPPLSYRTFRTIADCWNDRDSESDQTFLNLLRNRVRAVPDGSDLRNHLTKRWRYLRHAVEEIDLKLTVSSAVPFRVFGRFMKIIAQPRSDEENVLAAKEQSDLEK
jgi:hypothetical protein